MQQRSMRGMDGVGVITVKGTAVGKFFGVRQIGGKDWGRTDGGVHW